MTHPSYRGHRFPADVIQHAVWIYLRFTLSYRDVEELLAERGIQVSYETVRRWVHVFGPLSRVDCGPDGPSRMAAGIWTRCSSGSMESSCICGARLTPKEKCSMSWSSPGGTRPQPASSCESC